MITAFATTEQAVEAMRLGAYDYIQKPFKNGELLALIERRSRRARSCTRTARCAPRSPSELPRRRPDRQEPADAGGDGPGAARRQRPPSVLITGESGTGKELVARALHDARRARTASRSSPSTAAPCPKRCSRASCSGTRRARSPAPTRARRGCSARRDGGTLFLDEIGELPTPLQVKLLRVLQERKVRPVGGTQELEVDVRVVAATNRDVEQAVRDGSFREDLFYRLNVIRITLPPLRERREDIPALANHFLHKHSALEGKRLSFSSEALRWIAEQDYPGNVRELENVVERAVGAGQRALRGSRGFAARPRDRGRHAGGRRGAGAARGGHRFGRASRRD